MKKIEELHLEIYKVLEQGGLTLEESVIQQHGTAMVNHVAKRLSSADLPREVGKLWATDLGKKCTRQLWFEFYRPEAKEKLKGYNYIKFLQGNLLEEVVLILAKAAGYKVEGEQDRVEVKAKGGWAISGRMDAIIEGHICDVKSAASMSFNKYSTGGVTEHNDKFGYREQLYFYKYYRQNKETPYFLFIDKQLGHIQPVPMIDEIDLEGLADTKIVALSNPGIIPPRIENYDRPIGKSGNRELSTYCSYCQFKNICNPDLRTFLYSDGPKFLTEVTKEPKALEVTNG